jgi:hypothetical protein|nr:MAG TPA: hypothetical protein [Caudoviricetes sp.]
MLLEKLFKAINGTAEVRQVEIKPNENKKGLFGEHYTCITKDNKEFDVSFDQGMYERHRTKTVEFSWTDNETEYNAQMMLKVYHDKNIIEVSTEITTSTKDTWERVNKQLDLPFTYDDKDVSPHSMRRYLGFQHKFIDLLNQINRVTTIRENDSDLSPIITQPEINKFFRLLLRIGTEKCIKERQKEIEEL